MPAGRFVAKVVTIDPPVERATADAEHARRHAIPVHLLEHVGL
jgi:hypothetical protein